MKTRLPSFAREHNVVVPELTYVWACPMKGNARGFITFQINHKDDSFTVGIDWSPKGNYPQVVFTYPNEPTADGETSFRLGHLFGARSDYWWYLARTSALWEDFFEFVEDPIPLGLSRIEPFLDDTFEKIESYALPYFEKMSKETAR